MSLPVAMRVMVEAAVGTPPDLSKTEGWRALVECSVSAFDDTPLDGRERLDAAYLLFGHMRNSQSMTMAGTQPWLPDRQVRPALRHALTAASHYPALTDAIAAIPAQAARDNGRAFGLDVILDGLAVLIERG